MTVPMCRMRSALQVVAMSPLPLRAQLGTTRLNGRVRHPTGAVVPSARVKLDSTVHQFTRSATTDANGEYVTPSILPGSYKLTVSGAGFATATRIGIELSSGQASTLNVSLKDRVRGSNAATCGPPPEQLVAGSAAQKDFNPGAQPVYLPRFDQLAQRSNTNDPLVAVAEQFTLALVSLRRAAVTQTRELHVNQAMLPLRGGWGQRPAITPSCLAPEWRKNRLRKWEKRKEA